MELLPPAPRLQPLPDEEKGEIKWEFRGEPRKSQRMILDWLPTVEESKLIAIEAPTGCGKSPINVSFAASRHGIILTPTKQLQDQYVNDWKDAITLKGSGNYVCKTAPEGCSPVVRSCKVGAVRRAYTPALGERIPCRKASPCPYARAKSNFIHSQWAIANYACYFSLTHHDPVFATPHKWLVMDEGHHLESAIINAAAVSLREDFWKVAVKGEQFPTINNVEHFFAAIDKALMRFRSTLQNGGADDDQKSDSHVIMLAQELLDSAEFAQRELAECPEMPWCLVNEKDAITLKPLFPDRLIKLAGCKQILLTSATLPRSGLLRLWDSSYKEMKIDSDFPVENRPLYYKPAGSLAKNNFETDFPKVVRQIERILAHHKNEKGIIHCGSFKNCELLNKAIGSNGRLLFHNSWNKMQILEEHFVGGKPTVLVSPSMMEGVDLHHDLGRFNIIMKVPFPFLGDQWVKMRKDNDKEWYSWSTAKDIIQACGRTTRASDDYSSTYIIDSSFGRFYDQYNYLFPKWFKEGLH